MFSSGGTAGNFAFFLVDASTYGSYCYSTFSTIAKQHRVFKFSAI